MTDWVLSFMEQNLTDLISWAGFCISAMLGMTTIVLSDTITKSKVILYIFFIGMLLVSSQQCLRVLSWNKDLEEKLPEEAKKWIEDGHYTNILKKLNDLRAVPILIGFFSVILFLWLHDVQCTKPHIRFKGWNDC